MSRFYEDLSNRHRRLLALRDKASRNVCHGGSDLDRMRLNGDTMFATQSPFNSDIFNLDPWFSNRQHGHGLNFPTGGRRGHFGDRTHNVEDTFSQHRRIMADFGRSGQGFTDYGSEIQTDSPRVRMIPIQVIREHEPRREFAETQTQPRFVDVDYISDDSDYDDVWIVGEDGNNNGTKNLRQRGRAERRRPAPKQVRATTNEHSTREGKVDAHSVRTRPAATERHRVPPVLQIDDSLTECFRSSASKSGNSGAIGLNIIRTDSSLTPTSSTQRSTESEIRATPGYPVYAYLKSRLESDNRQIDYIQGDGNCFFRALAKDIYGQESFHAEVRQAVLDVIEKYPKEFEQYLDSGLTMKQHIHQMRLPSTWGTTMEIYAAATLLQRDIYVLSPDHKGESYNWLLFSPRFTYSGEMSFHPCYITLCHTNGNHYDRIAAKNKNCNCDTQPPSLRGVKAYVDLTNTELSVL